MNITLNTQRLAQELRLLNSIVSTKATIPVLANILFRAEDKLTLSATDLELALLTSCPATIEEMGSITIPSKKLLEIVEQLPNTEVRITADKKQARVISGAFNSRLQTLPADDFPKLPIVDGESSTLDGQAFKQMITRTRYAIADKAQTFIMSGALLSLNGVVAAMVTTDGKRLAIATAARPEGAELRVVLPGKTLDALFAHDVGSVEISNSARHLFFVVGERTLVSRMIEGQFPAYDRIIPRAHDKKVVIHRHAFAAALRRVGVVSEENQAIYLTLESIGRMTLNSSSASIGDADEQVPVEYSGPALRICINWKYLLDFLEAASGQSVVLEAKGEFDPLLLSDGDSFINVIMLMRT